MRDALCKTHENSADAPGSVLNGRCENPLRGDHGVVELQLDDKEDKPSRENHRSNPTPTSAHEEPRAHSAATSFVPLVKRRAISNTFATQHINLLFEWQVQVPGSRSPRLLLLVAHRTDVTVGSNFVSAHVLVRLKCVTPPLLVPFSCLCPHTKGGRRLTSHSHYANTYIFARSLWWGEISI